LKILIIADSISSNTGGGKVGILGVCRALMSYGNDVTLATSGVDEEYILSNNNSINVTIDGVNTFYFKPQVNLFGTRVSLSFIYYLFKNTISYDLVLTHSLYKVHSSFAAFMARKQSIPYVIRPHGSLDSFLINRKRRLLKKLFIYLFEKKNFKYASAIQFSCLLEEEKASKFISYWKKSIIVPEGIEQNKASNVPNTNNNKLKFLKDKNIFKILFLGRFHEKKGIELLLNAFSQATQKNIALHLVLAGTGDIEYVEKIKKLIEELNISHRCTITGYLSDTDKSRVMKLSNIFILTSYGENFGLAVVEAMSFSLPVLVSNNVGISDSINSAKAGKVFNCDVDEIVEAIDFFANNVEEQITYGNNAKYLADNVYTLSNMGLIMNKMYKDLVKI
tara:strand:+ start:7440 stop:8615 length:1176 start_codon:yes stop_codon:yes gene_type:complete